MICVMRHEQGKEGVNRGGKTARFDTDSVPIRVDNCASRCLSSNIDDFIDAPRKIHHRVVKGIGSNRIRDIYEATMQLRIEDDQGIEHDIIIPNAYYVPDARCRLLSPQHWSQEAKDNRPSRDGTWCATYSDRIVLYWKQRKYQRTIPLDPDETNVGTIYTAPGYKKHIAFCVEIDESEHEDLYFQANEVTDDEDDSSSEDQMDQEDDEIELGPRQQPWQAEFDLQGKGQQETPVIIEDEEDRVPQDDSSEFLRWHHRLGHVSPRKIQRLAKAGVLPSRLADCKVPLCTSCLYGKSTRRPWRTKIPNNKDQVSGTITRPGQCVSVDQLKSTTLGLIAQLRGRPTTKRYQYATVFVDHFSGLGYVHLQKTASGEETVEAKKRFEAFAASHGVRILHYHADNGIFADNEWRKAVADKAQTLSFCGVNAHFQNGRAERRIRELQDHARTMLIHASRRWPSAINAHLWPYALRMANDVFNNTPNIKTGDYPIELFSGSQVSVDPKHWFHFGSPVYVLDDSLQAQRNLDKWADRTRVGIYLGQSPQHARTVALVLSIETGLTSPQFHIKVDSTFQTMRKSFGEQLPKSLWQEKCQFTKSKSIAPVEMATEPAQEAEGGSEHTHESSRQRLREATEPEPVQPLEGAEGEASSHSASDQVENPTSSQEQIPEGVSLRRSQRRRKPRQRLIEAFATEVEEARGPNGVAYEVLAGPIDDDVDMDTMSPLIAMKATSDPDTMYLHEAMRQPDKKEFIKAMVKEVEAQTKNGNWAIVARNEVKEGGSILPAVWSMKRKRRISTREVYKWKARLNIDGSKQKKGINYWETYAPVASWPTIRFILTMIILKGWHTKQIDFVLAYTQAMAEVDDLYMEVPKGFEIPGSKPKENVLQIKKNIYGQKQAGRVWNKHLVQQLRQVGFKPSDVDECVFYKGNIIYVLYTDDSILAGPDEAELERQYKR